MGLGLLGYGARERGGEEEGEEGEGVVCRLSVTVLYIFPCRSAVLFPCVVISLPVFSPSLSVFPVTARYLSLSLRICSYAQHQAGVEAEAEEGEEEEEE